MLELSIQKTSSPISTSHENKCNPQKMLKIRNTARTDLSICKSSLLSRWSPLTQSSHIKMDACNAFNTPIFLLVCIIRMIKGEPHVLSPQRTHCRAVHVHSTQWENTHLPFKALRAIKTQLKNNTGKMHRKRSFRLSWDWKTSACVNLPFMPLLTVRLMLHPSRGNKTGSRSAKDLL